MAAGLSRTPQQATINAARSASGSRASVSLNSAFVKAASGAAILLRFICPVAAPIDELYIFMDDVGGTIGNVAMLCDIYNESSANVPGSTIRDTSSAATIPASVDKWIRFAFPTPYTPTVGEVLWFIAYNTAVAPTVDYPIILTDTDLAIGIENVPIIVGYSTTNGAAGNTLKTEMPFAVKMGTTVVAQPFTKSSTTYYASNLLRRGIRFRPAATVDVAGCSFTGNASSTLFEIYDASVAPGGATLNSYSLWADANEGNAGVIGAKIFDTMPRFRKGVDYNAVITYSGGSVQIPLVYQIEDYATYSAIFDAIYDGHSLCWSVIDNGAGGWTEDKAISPAVALLIGGLPTETRAYAA